jgi:hypothetical protein
MAGKLRVTHSHPYAHFHNSHRMFTNHLLGEYAKFDPWSKQNMGEATQLEIIGLCDLARQVVDVESKRQ